MTLFKNPDLDENEAWDEMLADLNLTPSGMKTHMIQSSDPNEALNSMLQEPHLLIKTTVHAATPSLFPKPTPSWREIQKRLDVEADDYRYHSADEIARHSLLEQQRKLVLVSAKRINDYQKRFEEIRLILQAPSACDRDAFSSQLAEIERVKLLIEKTPATRGEWDAAVDSSFPERKKDEKDEEVQETVSEIDWMEFENLAEGEAAILIARFLCVCESCKPFDVKHLRKTRKNLEYSPSSDGKIISVTKSWKSDCVTPTIVSPEFNCCVKSAAFSISAMD
jgi:hypothetical protein